MTCHGKPLLTEDQVPCIRCGQPKRDHDEISHDYEPETIEAQVQPEPFAWPEKIPGWKVLVDTAVDITKGPLVHLCDDEKTRRIRQLIAQCEARRDEIIPAEQLDLVCQTIIKSITTLTAAVPDSILQFVLAQAGNEFMDQYVRNCPDLVLTKRNENDPMTWQLMTQFAQTELAKIRGGLNGLMGGLLGGC